MNTLYVGDCRKVMPDLLLTLRGQVKAIYIDPPYNTGKQFTYKDNRESGEWTSLLRDSFLLGREFLTDDGVFLCSINEQNNFYVEELLNEVFGATNKVGSFIWQMRRGGRSDAAHVATDHEYIKIYARDIQKVCTHRFAIGEDSSILKDYKNRDNDPRGVYRTHNMDIGKLGGSTYDIECPDGTLLHSTSWRFSKQKFESERAQGRIFFNKTKSGAWRVYKKIYLSENKQVIRSILTDCGTTSEATHELEKILGYKLDKPVYPKPVRLITKMIEFSTQPGDIVMDFFAGTGTTGQVCAELQRQFVLITLNEPVGESTFVDKITIPRLRKKTPTLQIVVYS